MSFNWCLCSAQCTSRQQLSQCPKEFEEQFMEAWKAIENHDFASLQRSISKMTEVAQGFHSPLDVFRVLGISGILYPMTLLALCGFHRQKEMVELLLREGAKIDAGCNGCGAPLFQMIFHCFIHKMNEVDTNMVKYFIEKRSPLTREICSGEYDCQSAITGGITWSVLDLPLTMGSMNGIEVAKVLVTFGKIDCITGGAPNANKYDVVPMFQEYWLSGTNYYIRWLCKEYLSDDQRREFVNQVVECITSMNQRLERWIHKRRIPSHAMLTCGHQETIKLLLQRDSNLLKEKNSTGKTALYMAAEDGDLESVEILLELGADVTAHGYSDLNPFMVAIEKNHLEVAMTILEKNPDCLGSQSAAKIFNWALERKLTSFVQCIGEKIPDILVTPIPHTGDNTMVHLMAASGNTEIFKVILKILWTEEHVTTIVENTNNDGKTALHIAVEKGCIDILKALQECIERPGMICTWETKLQGKWPSEVIPELFCHAASCGSLVAVKYFIDCGYKANISHKDKTPLLCASEAGHDEIVKYLLEFSAVSSDPEHLKLPLLHAATNGCTKCVSLLLQETSVHHTDKDGKNCLTLAIENDHRATALAILSDKNQGLAALRCVHKNKTPLRLLIKDMPELAEYVLNRSITEKKQDTDNDVPDSAEPGGATPQTSVIQYDFQVLEDFSRDDKPEHDTGINIDGEELIELEETDYGSLERQSDPTTHTPGFHLEYDSDNHILRWMVKYKRLKLLQHPLVKRFLLERYWLVAIPFFVLYLLFYTSLLILLTSFALVSPRPGPDSETCPEQKPNTTANDTDCPGQSGGERTFLAAAAIIMIIQCLLLIFIEAVQLRQRHFKYFKEWDNYFQLTCFVLIIAFVAPGFTNNCWCAHNGQWQIGAFALCLGWFNLIVLLKDMPCTAVPVNMFINICITFLKLLFLPFLLLLAFAFPFYMVFARTANSFEGPDPPGELVAFRSPAHAIARTIVQIVGEIDFEVIFNEGDLLYNPTTYILFVIFLITVPILFVNLLIGLAVGDTNEEKAKAEFTKLAVPVEFILERERHSELLRFVCYEPEAKHTGPKHLKVMNKLKKRNQAIFSDVMEVTSELEKILQLNKDINALTEKVEASTLTQAERESEKILQLEKDIKALTEKVEART